MTPAAVETSDMSSDSHPRRSASQSANAFIDNLVTMCRRDAGDRSRLRRTLRNDDQIDATSWWLLGAWLPEEHPEALIKVRVAGLYAAAGANGHGIPYRTLGGEMALANINEHVARRVLESVTDPGSNTVSRVGHLIRVLPQCEQDGSRIDWALLHDDLRGLASANPDWQRRIRSRWYRQYHNPNPSGSKDTP